MLNWANRFSIFCFLDGNGYPAGRAFPVMLAAGVKRSVSLTCGSAFESLRNFFDREPSYLFGHLGFSLMEETEGVKNSRQSDPDFGPGFFFEPEIIVRVDGELVTIHSEKPGKDVFEEILDSPDFNPVNSRIQVSHVMSRDEYLDAVTAVMEHIALGDCYELNYCQSFRAKDADMDPIAAFRRLMEFSPNPFSALYRLDDLYCICASPERFLKKSGDRVVCQPMKGTAPRFADMQADDQSMLALKESKKEISENVMIVDLVRNDLSKCCVPGTVEVEELFGVYSFPLVHQMVSTISGRISGDTHWSDLLKACFPMGSMTGAPKKKVLELTSRYEKTGRGLFSGSIGYIDPAGDLDFNVVIRSIFYDNDAGELSFHTGGGITFYSDPRKEYEESMLKAAAMMKVLTGS